MPPSSNRKRQFLEAETIAALRGDDISGLVSRFVVEMAYRRFRPDDTLEKRVALHEAVRAYLDSGSREFAEAAVLETGDIYSIRQDLLNHVSHTPFFGSVTSIVVEAISKNRPDLITDDIGEIVGRCTLAHLVDEMIAADRSSALDIAAGKQVTLCFIPGSSQTQNYWDIATTSWLAKSDSLSIYPDSTFLDFLGVIGLNKSEWLSAVNRNVTTTAMSRMNHFHSERASAWNRVDEWDQNGSLDVDVDDVVAAVDACPYGFTPMIAFTMDAEEVLSLDFRETLEVTGGIVGLHDFTNGSGDPIRFEGTLRLSPKVGDMHLADDQPLGLIATHGFLSSAFQSVVNRVQHTSPIARHEFHLP